MLELYKNIKKFRIEQHMTQSELARLTDYTDRSSIAKIEAGEVDLPQSKIRLFAKAFGVTPSTLMGNTGLYSWLPSDEAELLERYGRLNASGKAKVMEYMQDLLDNRKYVSDMEKSSLSGTA